MIYLQHIYSLIVLFLLVHFSQANFEDSRCRCTCPSTRYFSSLNDTNANENQRRYYTKTNVDAGLCNPQTVVKQIVYGIVNDAHMDAFLANCDCKHESRNTILLKIVVIFVICVLFVLGTYMVFLVLLDPMLKRQRHPIPYNRHTDENELEENIFASRRDDDSIQMRPRNAASATSKVLNRVEAEKNKWKSSVEEQRSKVFAEHSMLN
uniref:Transmembrane protein 9 n=2 Tax=Panagrolaimus sp. ES5 TaxID=591445 RepID=A0AC34F978_9BILA